MNPLEMIQALMGAKKNPKQFLMKNFLGNNPNPMIQNLVNMAEKGDSKGVENFARNICKEKGIDFDKSFPEFMQTFKR